MLLDLYPQLEMTWQPVMDLHLGTPWAYEALLGGPADSPYENPDALVALARDEGLGEQHDAYCLDLALRQADEVLPSSAMLLVPLRGNVGHLPPPPANPPWPATRTVIEVSEHSPLFEQPSALLAELAPWRAAGYHIAFSDFGSGFGGAQALLACRPDIVKIERQLVHGIDADTWRQEMVASIVQSTTDLGAAVVADGIDAVAELHELVRLRVALGEGPLLGRAVPATRIARFTDSWLQSRIDVSDALTAAMPKTGAAYAVDRSRHIVAWNEGAVEVSGYQPGAVVGATCWLSGLDHKDAAGTRLCFNACPLVRAMQTGKPQSDIVSLRTAGGARRWIETHVTPVTDESGKVIGAVESFSRAHRPEMPKA